MSCQEENNFLRFSDTPSIDKEGFVKVASSKEQLENMSLEDKERVVASVALLDAFTKEVQETIDEISENISESEGLDEKIKQVVKSLGDQSPQTLDIPQLFIIPNITGAELRWNEPNFRNNYKVKVFQKYKDEKDFTEIAEEFKGKNYSLLFSENIDLKREPKWYVRAYSDNDAGKPSNEVKLNGVDWSDIILQLLQGKITETALARSVVDNIHNSFSSQLNTELNRQLERARTIINQTEKQINTTITGLRDRLNQDIVQVKGQLQDHGTNISTLERKSNEHAERIDTISAVADNAVSGLQQEKVARATAQEAYAREVNTKISQVEGSIATVRHELETKATQFDSITKEVRDFRNTYNQNEVRQTEQLTNLANADKAINEKIKQVDAKTVNSQAKLEQLENVVAEKDRASTKRFSALRSSINGSHFPNYSFEDEANGWTTLQGEVSVIDTKDQSASQKLALQAIGNMPVTIHSNEPTKIELAHSYSLSANLKCPDGVTKAELVIMCFDKDKKIIKNIQTNPNYPLIDSKTNAGKGWISLEGQISGNTTSWPTTDNTKIPLHTVYASPALIVTTKTGGKIWVTKLDMQDNTESEKNKALIKALETTQNTDRESIATTLREQETRLKNGFSTTTQQLQNKITEVDGKITAEASKITTLNSKVNNSESMINSLQQTINNDRSSNAAKFETMETKFRRDLSNAIENPNFTKIAVTTTLDNQGQVQVTGEETVTSYEGWDCEPKNKLSVITFAQNTSNDLKTKSPSNYYLKFWGNSLVAKNQLQVNENDKIFVGLHAHNLNNANVIIAVRYLNKEGTYLSQKDLANFNGYVKINETLTVPANADKAELVIFTNNNTLAERQAVIISKPELRANAAAIYADGKLEEAKVLVSNAQETVTRKIDSLTATYNGSEARNKLERQAIARNTEAISSKVEEQGTKIAGAEAKIRTIEATQTTQEHSIATINRTVSSNYSSLNSKADDLYTKVNNLKIGTRNYLNDANFKRGVWKFSKGANSTGTHTVDIENGVITMTVPTLGTGQVWNQYQVSGIETGRLSLIEDRTEVTLSVEAMSTDSDKPRFWLSLRSDPTSGAGTDTVRLNDQIVTDQWVRYKVTGIASKSANFANWRYILGFNDKGTIKFRRPQVEIGNVATDFKLAPEDIETTWTKLSTQQNLNNLDKSGNYHIAYANNINAPISNSLFLIVDRVDNNKIKQTIQADNDPGKSYTRIKTGDTWSNWIRISNEQDVATINTFVNNVKAIADSGVLKATQADAKAQSGVDKANAAQNSANQANTAAANAQRLAQSGVDKANQFKQDLQNQLDNVRVGSRNLLETSGGDYGYSKWYSNRAKAGHNTDFDPAQSDKLVLSSTDKGGWVNLNQTALMGRQSTRTNGSKSLTYIDVTRPLIFTADTFEYPKTGQWSLFFIIRNTYKQDNTPKFDDIKVNVTNANVAQFVKSGKLVVKFPVPSNYSANLAKNDYYEFKFETLSPNVRFEFTNVKLEQGTIPTDWTPAPEDLEYRIANVNRELETAKSDIRTTEKSLSDKYGTLAERVTTVESNAKTIDGRINNAILEERERTEATAERVAAEKSSELKVSFERKLENVQGNLLSNTDTLHWMTGKSASETNRNATRIVDGVGILNGDTNFYKEIWQPSREGQYATNKRASISLSQVGYNLPYVLTFEAKANKAGLILRNTLRLYHNTGNRNSNVVDTPLTTDWKSYRIELTSPVLNENETHKFFGVFFQFNNTGEIQFRNPVLYYDAQKAIDKFKTVEASIKETKKIAIDAQGKVDSKIGLRVNANGKIVGWSASVNGDYNDFAINADKFMLSNGANNYQPFTVDARTGQITFNGKVSFNSITNAPNFQSIAQTEANKAKDQAKSELSSSIADAKKASDDAKELADQIKSKVDWKVITTPTDLNTLTETGKYFLQVTNNPNSPNTGWIYVEVEKASDQRISQVMYSDNNLKERYIRTKFDNNWLSWEWNVTGENNVRDVVRTTTDIDGANIRTGTVDLQRLYVKPGNNLLFNAEFRPNSGSITDSQQPYYTDGRQNFTGWSFVWWNEAVNRSVMDWVGTGDRVWGSNGSDNAFVLRLYLPGNVSSNSAGTNKRLGDCYQNVVTVPGQDYIFSVGVGSHRCRVLLAIEDYAQGNRYVRGNSIKWVSEQQYANFVSNPNGWRHWIRFTARSNITSIRCIMHTMSTRTNDVYQYMFLYKPMLEEVTGPNTITPSDWVPGPSVMLDNELKVNSLSAISANLGVITAGSININNRSGINSNGHLWATGANINGTITATGGSISGWLTMGDNSNGVILKGNDRRIDVMENNVLKVRLGAL